MRKSVWLCGLILALAIPSMAQDQAPKFDLFGGYSYVRVKLDTTAAGGTGTVGLNANGGSASAALYLNNWIGIVGDFGGYKISSQTITVPGGPVTIPSTDVISYLFGPRIAFGRSGRVSAFGQALFGGARLADSPVKSGSDNEFAMTVGGGADWNATRHLGIRLIQAEYFLTKFSDGHNNRQNNARISAGVVFRF